jgi:predicted DsbA family dithiol-disulfide isomerase
LLTLFHDYTSPGSALAVERVQRLGDEGLDVAFEGFEAIGLDATLPVTVDVAAAVADLAPVAAVEGVELRRPPNLPPTVLAHVVGTVAEQAGRGASWRSTCYRAFWSDGAAIGERGVLLDLADRAGLDTGGVAAALDDRLLLAKVRRRMADHRRNGVGGVPTILASRTLVPGLLPMDELRALAQLA